MAETQRHEDFEQDLYETTVEEAVEEVSGLTKGKSAEAEQIIQEFLNEAELSDKHATTFRGEVLRKVAERKRQVKDERERKILEKFEGQVVTRSGELRFAGVEENAKFYARAGSLFHRIFGKRYSAKEVDDILHEVQKLEDDLEQNRLQLEMLKAARDASSNFLRNARKIFKNKRRSKIFGDYVKDAADSWRAARAQKKRTAEEYKTTGKAKIKEIEVRSKELGKQKAVLDAVRAKIEERRKDGRVIFQDNFGTQVAVLKKMSGKERQKEEARLRKDTREFGKDIGIIYMEYFLNEALGITPKTAKAELTAEGTRLEAGTYVEPLTERESAKERAVFSRWLEFILGEKPSQVILLQTLPLMKEREPRLLRKLLDEGKNVETSDNLEVRFLLSGRDTTGKSVLDISRCAKTDPQNIVKFFRYAREHSITDRNKLQQIMTTFAQEWPEYSASDFDYVLEYIEKGHAAPGKIPQSTPAAQTAPASTPSATPSQPPPSAPPATFGAPPAAPSAAPDVLSDTLIQQYGEAYFRILGRSPMRSDILELDKKMREEWPDKTEYLNKRGEFLRARPQHDIIGFFMTGEFDGEKIATKKTVPSTPENILKLYQTADALLNFSPPPTKNQLKELFRKRKENVRHLAKLSPDDIKSLL